MNKVMRRRPESDRSYSVQVLGLDGKWHTTWLAFPNKQQAENYQRELLSRGQTQARVVEQQGQQPNIDLGVKKS